MSGAHAKQPATRRMRHSGLCDLDGCGRKYYAKGYCRKHWERNHINGSPDEVQAVHGTPAERLAAHSLPAGECIEFTGYRDKNGYGKMPIDGVDTGAHRVAFEVVNGPIPDGLVVRHKCDNPPCINPLHLELGTHGDNGQDKATRDRSTHGEGNPGAKLTEPQVIQIRKLLRSGIQQREIAERFGVGQSTISRIKKGTHWVRTIERAEAA